MTDRVSKEIRSKNMSAVRSKRTKLEDKVANALWRKGVRFRRNVPDLWGKPDLAIKKYKIVIFIDSCFWHGCPLHGSIPQTNVDFWMEKLKKNIKRDKEITHCYVEENWHIKRIWEHDLKCDFEGTIDELLNFILKIKKDINIH